MRDNGLHATSWAFLVDVVPPIAGEVLDLLATAGIAARATPYEATNPAGYPSIDSRRHFNGGPLERVDVDKDKRAAAVSVLQSELPAAVAPLEAEVNENTRIDSEFRSIVAGLGSVSGEPVSTTSTDGRSAGYADPLTPESPGYLETDDHYVPPPPPPIPRGNTAQRFAWAAMILCPLYLLFQGATGWGLGPVGNMLAIGGIIVAFVYLLSTLGDHRDDEDDGAVV